MHRTQYSLATTSFGRSLQKYLEIKTQWLTREGRKYFILLVVETNLSTYIRYKYEKRQKETAPMISLKKCIYLPFSGGVCCRNLPKTSQDLSAHWLRTSVIILTVSSRNLQKLSCFKFQTAVTMNQYPTDWSIPSLVLIYIFLGHVVSFCWIFCRNHYLPASLQFQWMIHFLTQRLKCLSRVLRIQIWVVHLHELKSHSCRPTLPCSPLCQQD